MFLDKKNARNPRWAKVRRFFKEADMAFRVFAHLAAIFTVFLMVI